MPPIFQATDSDHQFFEENLRDFLPERIVDIHTHLVHPPSMREPSPERLKRYWMLGLPIRQTAEDFIRSYESLLPGKRLKMLTFGMPLIEADAQAQNAYVLESFRAWPCLNPLALALPGDSEEALEAVLDAGFLGFKPYPDYVVGTVAGEERIADFLTTAMCRVADRRKAIVMLHISRRLRFADPENIQDLLDLEWRYPGMRLIIAHLGRSYNPSYLNQGITLLEKAGNQGRWNYDFSAVANPASIRLALEKIDHHRICFGLDTPIVFARGYYEFPTETTYAVHIHGYNLDAPSHLPIAYQILDAFRQAAQAVGLSRGSIERIFHGNAEDLFASSRIRQNPPDMKSQKGTWNE